jgi:type I restriction enzyme S subunit
MTFALQAPKKTCPEPTSKVWRSVRLGDIAKTASGGTPKRTSLSFYGGNIPWVKSGELGDSTVYETEETITEAGLKGSSAKVFPKGTLCVALYGATVGKLGVLGMDAATNQAVCGIFLPPELDTRFAYRFLESKRRELVEMGKGGAQPNISQEIIRDLQFPLPSLDEQREIVAEIEKQFTRLEAGVGALKRVQGNLKRYRAAVLKAACEGKLVPTEAELAKAEGRTYETGEQLLQRILTERRKNWTGRCKYKEPATPDATNLPELPEGWAWATAEHLCGFITKGTTPSANKMQADVGEIPFIKVYNLTFTGMLNLAYKPVFVSRQVHESELARSDVRAGDVLINIVGPPLGQVSIVPPQIHEANINQAIARFRVILESTRKYLALCLMTDSIMNWATERAKTTAGQSNLTLELCRDLPVPIPPLAEQERIIKEVECRLSIIEELEATVLRNLQRATRLRQSILQKAFSGELSLPV